MYFYFHWRCLDCAEEATVPRRLTIRGTCAEDRPMRASRRRGIRADGQCHGACLGAQKSHGLGHVAEKWAPLGIQTPRLRFSPTQKNGTKARPRPDPTRHRPQPSPPRISSCRPHQPSEPIPKSHPRPEHSVLVFSLPPHTTHTTTMTMPSQLPSSFASAAAGQNRDPRASGRGESVRGSGSGEW